MFLKKFFYVQKPRYLSIFNRETNILFKQGLFTQCSKLSFIPNNIVSIYNFFIQMILWIQETMSLMEKTLTLPMKKPQTPMTSLRIPAVTSLRTMTVTMIKTKSGQTMICVSMKMLTILVIFLFIFLLFSQSPLQHQKRIVITKIKNFGQRISVMKTNTLYVSRELAF